MTEQRLSNEFSLEKCQRNEQGHYLCQTKDGRPARVVCVDRLGSKPIVVLTDSPCGDEFISTRYINGRLSDDHRSDNDLINLPAKITKYAGLCRNKYEVWLTQPYTSAASVHEMCEVTNSILIKIIPIEWEEPA